MPNFDGGHYFLTALLPVKTGLLDDVDRSYTSHTHALRSYLAWLAPALQSRANEQRGVNSPFARNRRTHFARLVVIDDVAFNGRTGRDSLLVALAMRAATVRGLGFLKKFDPLRPQHVDQLPSPYLILVVDFDASSGDGDVLDAYLRELWADMGEELGHIVKHCDGFDRVRSAEAFAHAVRRRQVETTMPFNDYWQNPPDLGALALPLLKTAAPAAIGLVALLAGLVGWLSAAHAAPWCWAAWIGAAVLLGGLVYAYRTVMRHGAKPFPTAPDSDLPSVLKALHVQQKFVRFAIDNQGADAAALHAAFGAFLAAHRPENLEQPTQPPGVVRS